MNNNEPKAMRIRKSCHVVDEVVVHILKGLDRSKNA